MLNHIKTMILKSLIMELNKSDLQSNILMDCWHVMASGLLQTMGNITQTSHQPTAAFILTRTVSLNIATANVT